MDGETVLIDLRDQSDPAVADGIPGAIPATPQMLTSWAAGSQPDMPFALEKDRRIIVYSSDDSESRQVVEALRDLGFGRVAYLIGGLDSWTQRHTAEPASTDATDLEEAGRMTTTTETRTRTTKTRAWALGAAAALAIIIVAAVVLATGGERQTVGVNWHAQQESAGNVGPVDGASATLVRRDSGIAYEFNANSLTPGNAYTLWLVVINNPEACAASPCTGADIFQNDATGSQVLYGGDGDVAGDSGELTLSGSLSEGSVEGWLGNRDFEDAETAQIHLVLNDHGPELAEFMPGMIETYRGGCSDDSPFPEIFPATALADGEVGPNTCLLTQAAVFLAP